MKMFTKTAIIALVFLVGFQTTFAAYGKIFGGKITTTDPSEIPEIQNAIDSGFTICDIPGTTVQVESKKSKVKKSFLVPYEAKRATPYLLTAGMSMIHKYLDTGSFVLCTNPESGTSMTIILPNVTYYGTSRR